MKNLLKLSLLTFVFALSSCEKDEQENSPNEKLTANGLIGEWSMTHFYQEVDLNWEDGTGSVSEYNGNNYSGTINFDASNLITSDLTVICIVETRQNGSSQVDVDTESYGSIFDDGIWSIVDGKLVIEEDGLDRTFSVKSYTSTKLEIEENVTVPASSGTTSGTADVLLQITFQK